MLGLNDAARLVDIALAGSDPDGRSGRWTPGCLQSAYRAECTLLRYTPECAAAYGRKETEKQNMFD